MWSDKNLIEFHILRFIDVEKRVHTASLQVVSSTPKKKAFKIVLGELQLTLKSRRWNSMSRRETMRKNFRKKTFCTIKWTHNGLERESSTIFFSQVFLSRKSLLKMRQLKQSSYKSIQFSREHFSSPRTEWSGPIFEMKTFLSRELPTTLTGWYFIFGCARET